VSTVLEDPLAPAPLVDAPTATPGVVSETPAPGFESLVRPITREELLRPAIGALATTLACSFLVGGMFVGYSPRIYAAIGGIVGVAMAVWAASATKRVSLVQAMSFGGILLAGMILLAVGDIGAVSRLGEVVGEAAKNARLRRPPAPFDLGWRAILPWTMGMIGYLAAWIGVVNRKAAVGILVPIPVIAFSAIAQPSEAQIPSGIIAFVGFVVGLTVIYRADRGEGEGVSTAYELKRAARAAPLVIVLIVALAAASQLNILFPTPRIDPTQRAQLPRAVPLSGVKDRVLFTNQSEFTGPWRAGVLDVFDGENWRLPPYSASTFKPAPKSGLLGDVFGNPVPNQVRAHVTIEGLEGTVIPLPARMYGIVVERGPALVVDARTQTVRVAEGQVDLGLGYDAVFALLPTESTLREAGAPDAELLREFTDTAHQEPPAAVRDLLAKADAQTTNLWDRLDFLRQALLDTVTASGQGVPAPVPPAKIQDMLAGSKEASPFEIVAAQAVLARWAGIPARIGYGFDRGEKVGSTIEYRPKHGAAWLEVYFRGSGWLPITGLPKKAKQRLGSGDQTIDANVLPGDEIAVQLFIPLRVQPKNFLFKQIQIVLLMVTPFLITIGLVWLLWPVAYKSRRRSRRRLWAASVGRAERIAVSYADFRDGATDLGVGDPYATPLAYVEKVVPDDEHRELAWLVSRALWGDMRKTLTDDDVFAAEELSRSLRRRLFEAQPFTIRGIALISRLSLRNPYAPELLSPPLEKFSWKQLHSHLPRMPRRAAKETFDDAIEPA